MTCPGAQIGACLGSMQAASGLFDQPGEVPWMHDIGRDASSSYAEDMSDGTWMTYAELAALRRINQASAFKLALRRRWRRQKNNTGQMTVFVPSAWSDTSLDDAHDMSRRTEAFRGDPTDLTRAISALEAAVSALRDQLAAANGRADRAEAGREAERERANDLAGRLADAQAELAAAQSQAEAATARAMAAMQADLAKAEAEGDALTIETAELTAQVKAAKAEAREAQDRAEELQRADATRRGRGRLARLRAAWRGSE
jgi:hypothetical protein